jgi:hypothetical protein
VVLTEDVPAAVSSILENPAFDMSGDLRVANYVGNTVVEYTKKELVVSGSPHPR